METKKKKIVKVGGMSFTFSAAGFGEGVFDCERVCTYYKYCEHIKDPRNLEDLKMRFIDFCGSIGEFEGCDGNLIPVDGTVEENFKDDLDIMNQLIDKNPPLVNVKDFIDNVCRNFCDSHKLDYSECKSDNAGCLLNMLFKNKNIISVKGNDDIVSTLEFNTTDAGALKEELDTDKEESK